MLYSRITTGHCIQVALLSYSGATPDAVSEQLVHLECDAKLNQLQVVVNLLGVYNFMLF